MAYTISHATMEKLLHPIQEIRIRSLHDIENTLKRALWENAEISLNAIALFKNLIRWFANSPMCEEFTVLELLLLLLESKYGKEIVKFYTPDRITKELIKIRNLIGSNIKCDQLASNVVKQVFRMKHGQIESSMASGTVNSIADSLGAMKLDGSEVSNGDEAISVIDLFVARWDGDTRFFTECWEVPDKSVMGVFERLNESLFDEANPDNFHRAINYVIPYTKDYPPEFFLQPPYIGLSLLQLIQRRRIEVRKGFSMLLYLMESFRRRMRQRMLTVTYMPVKADRRRTQLSIGGFVYEMFQLGIEQLKELSGDCDKMAANMILIVLSQTTTILMSEHFSEQQKIPPSRFGELCRDLGYLVKHYRQEWESDSKRAFARTRYRITMQIMLDFVRLWQKEPEVEPELDAAGYQPQGQAGVGAMASYNPGDFATLNTTAHRKALEQADSTWRDECKLALLDYPLKLACPEMYEHLCTHVGKENERLLLALTQMRDKMFHAVLLLRDGTSKLTDVALLTNGMAAMTMLCFHRSSGIVRSILKAVENCAGLITEDGPLWDIIEAITVRLLAHADEKIRCEAYEMCLKMMKDFIGQLDEGPILTRRSGISSSSPKLRAMGIPLTGQIITEIASFGYTSTNRKIKQCAETMLLFLLNSKAFLQERWLDVQEVLLLTAPFIQMVAVGREDSKLRRVVIGMFHPEFGLPFLDALQGNVRLLYHEESVIREEALTRVLFLINTVHDSKNFAPRIENISDTVPNGICLVSFPFDIACHKTASVYDASAVQPLLDALEQEEGGDPALRRGALMQLNVLAEDPELCEVIHSTYGWSAVLKALFNAMRTDRQHLDYPDAALPAVGILNKLCFRFIQFRRFLSSDASACHLIVRALLMHHHMPVFRLECCALLYLLVFADSATGTGPLVSLPVMFAKSPYKIPFVTDFHWHCSPMREESQLELLFQSSLVDDFAPKHASLGPNSESILRVDGGKQQDDSGTMNGSWSALSTTNSSSSASGTSRPIIWEYVKRYVRFTFADLWYEGLDKIQTKLNSAKRTNAVTPSLDEEEDTPLEYKGSKPALDFSPKLRLTKRDIRWLKVIDFPSIFRQSIRRLSVAKAHADVYGGLATLEANLIFPLKNTVCQQDIIISTLKRYLHTPPVSEADQKLLVEVFNIIGIMLHIDFRMVRDWLVAVLETDANFFLRLLRSEDCIEALHTKNANLLLRLVHQYDVGMNLGDLKEQQTQQQAPRQQPQWNVRVFQTALDHLDVVLRTCDLPRIISLMEVLEALSGRVDHARIDVPDVVSKLVQCIRLIKSTTYSGSAIVRSCLMTIAHLLEHAEAELNRFEWKPKQLKTISTQCSNSCTLVRSIAWNILAKVACSLDGAATIVRECAYLPGGIHASCVSTVLDTHEASLVKEAAVGLLVKLLCHNGVASVDPFDGAVHLRKANGTTGGAAAPPVAKTSLELVAELLAKQRFFDESIRSLEHYTCMEFVMDGDLVPTAVLVSADLVKAYAVLYRCLIEMDPVGFGKQLFEKGCVQGLLECVEMQAVLPNRAVCLMVAEVCTLLLRCLDEPTRTQVCELLAGHQTFVESVIYMLNPYLYGKLTQPVMEQTLCSIMRFLTPFVMTPSGKHQIHLEFGQKDVKPIARMIQNAILHKSQAFQTVCSRFLSLMLYTSDSAVSPTAEYPSFLIQFETMDMFTDGEDTTKPVKTIIIDEQDTEIEEDTENTNPNRPSAATFVVDDKQTKPIFGKVDFRSASAFIFQALSQRYELSCSREQLETGGVTTSIYKRTLYATIQTMLHYSGQACRVARACNLLGIILEWYDAIHEGLIGRLTYQEFVRRNGETKKQYVMAELKELATVLASWFSLPDEALLLHIKEIDELCQIVLMYWSWFTNNHALLLEMLQVLGFLTESHIIMCKALANTFPGYSHSIMKLLIVTATTETAKVKGPKCDLQVLKLALRVLRNCCCCHEGRNMIGKLNVFDNLSKLHPSVTKLQKPWMEVTQLWLEFWEVYTRYIDVSEVRHLTVLGALVRKSGSELRLLALAIIRNLTFVLANRPALLASSDYMFILQNALQRTASEMEVLMAAVTVWKMIANNQRGKAAIKSSPLVRLIAGQVKHYSMTPDGNDQNQLWGVLMTVYRILGA
uniref:Rotatin N-terminal domain-containing protein n=1 Tax=Anopheles farauti TaxID=69004 RepID=A0A182QXR5_9DIPT